MPVPDSERHRRRGRYHRPELPQPLERSEPQRRQRIQLHRHVRVRKASVNRPQVLPLELFGVRASSFDAWRLEDDQQRLHDGCVSLEGRQ